MSEERTFTTEELARYDGREGRPCYVAYEGQVYDLSASDFSWAGGEHYEEHLAGRDLTEEMAGAPHGGEALAPFPVVGRLV